MTLYRWLYLSSRHYSRILESVAWILVGSIMLVGCTGVHLAALGISLLDPLPLPCCTAGLPTLQYLFELLQRNPSQHICLDGELADHGYRAGYHCVPVTRQKLWSLQIRTLMEYIVHLSLNCINLFCYIYLYTTLDNIDNLNKPGNSDIVDNTDDQNNTHS